MNALDAMNTLDHSDVYHWQVELTPKKALEYAVKINDDNLFGFLDKINQIMPCPQYEEGNPNNGKMVHTFFIGQEYSRVVYISLVPTYIPKRQANYAELPQKIREIAQNYHADEIDEVHDRLIFKMRIWWD
jgi:hypothetical protein